jgi:hypothetical protein
MYVYIHIIITIKPSWCNFDELCIHCQEGKTGTTVPWGDSVPNAWTNAKTMAGWKQWQGSIWSQKICNMCMCAWVVHWLFYHVSCRSRVSKVQRWLHHSKDINLLPILFWKSNGNVPVTSYTKLFTFVLILGNLLTLPGQPTCCDSGPWASLN